MPDFAEGFGRGTRFFANPAGKAHAGQRAVGFCADIEQFGIELHDVRFLRELVALLELHLDFGGHFGAAELADVLHVAAVVGGLQADEVELGLAQEAIDIEVGGQTRKVAVKAARNGMLYAWDRATGKLAQEPFMHTYQDIMKGVDMATGLPMYNIDKIMFTNLEDRRRYTQVDPMGANKPADYTGTEAVFCPGTAARNWENDAYSPQTKLLYTATDNSCGALRMVTGEYRPGDTTLAYRLRVTLAGAPNLGMDGKATPALGSLKAFDVGARTTKWTRDWTGDANRNPVLATASGLLFQGGTDKGVMRAINAANGEVAWEFRAGARFHQSPITYLGPDKKQYVAIIASSAAANTAVAANAAPDNANRYRRSGSTLYVFKLPG